MFQSTISQLALGVFLIALAVNHIQAKESCNVEYQRSENGKITRIRTSDSNFVVIELGDDPKWTARMFNGRFQINTDSNGGLTTQIINKQAAKSYLNMTLNGLALDLKSRVLSVSGKNKRNYFSKASDGTKTVSNNALTELFVFDNKEFEDSDIQHVFAQDEEIITFVDNDCQVMTRRFDELEPDILELVRFLQQRAWDSEWDLFRH